MKTKNIEDLTFSDLKTMRDECVIKGQLHSNPILSEKYVKLHIRINSEIDKRIDQFIK